MRARLGPPIILLLLLAVLQWQLWNGRGSVRDVAQLRTKLADGKEANAKATLNNERLTSEVNSRWSRTARARNSAWSSRTKCSYRSRTEIAH
jgi:cell division protein FtsB